MQACAYVRLPACSRVRTQELRAVGGLQAAGGVAAQFLRSMRRRLLQTPG